MSEEELEMMRRADKINEELHAQLDQLRKELSDAKQMIEKLKIIFRFQHLTLGYYGTPYNYDDKNIAYHPITGEAASGIKADGGHRAREALELAKQHFGKDEIVSWNGPGELAKLRKTEGDV